MQVSYYGVKIPYDVDKIVHGTLSVTVYESHRLVLHKFLRNWAKSIIQDKKVDISNIKNYAKEARIYLLESNWTNVTQMFIFDILPPEELIMSLDSSYTPQQGSFNFYIINNKTPDLDIELDKKSEEGKDDNGSSESTS